jgi:hypothetical protein
MCTHTCRNNLGNQRLFALVRKQEGQAVVFIRDGDEPITEVARELPAWGMEVKMEPGRLLLHVSETDWPSHPNSAKFGALRQGALTDIEVCVHILSDVTSRFT